MTQIEEVLEKINNELSEYYSLNNRLVKIKTKVSGADLDKEGEKNCESPSNLLSELNAISMRINDNNSVFNSLLNNLESAI